MKFLLQMISCKLFFTAYANINPLNAE